MRHEVFALAAVAVLAFTVQTPGQELTKGTPDLQIGNTAKLLATGVWRWTVFVVADDTVLESIDSVEYTLHPSLPEPVRLVRERSTGFALTVNAQREFMIFLKVSFLDGSSAYHEHWLNLQEKVRAEVELDLEAPPEVGKIELWNRAKQEEGGWWSWSVFIRGDDQTIQQVKCVEYLLHPTFQKPRHKKCEKPPPSSVEGFHLPARGWGTFTVYARVVFDDGTEMNLEHLLNFPSD